MAYASGQSRCSLLQDVHLSRLVDRQHASRLHAEGRGDYRRDQMARRQIRYGDSIAGWLIAYDWSKRRTVLARPLGTPPACEKSLECLCSRAVSISWNRCRPQRLPSFQHWVRNASKYKGDRLQHGPASAGWRVESQPFGDAASAIASTTGDFGTGQPFLAHSVHSIENYQTICTIVDERTAPGANALRQLCGSS